MAKSPYIRRFIPEDSTLDLKPTPTQVNRITQYCKILGIKSPLESSTSNRREANDLIYHLRGQVRTKNAERKARRALLKKRLK